MGAGWEVNFSMNIEPISQTALGSVWCLFSLRRRRCQLSRERVLCYSSKPNYGWFMIGDHIKCNSIRWIQYSTVVGAIWWHLTQGLLHFINMAG